MIPMPTEAEPVVVIEGDCLDVLPTLADGSVDAVVTDPPFGVRDDEWDDMDEQEFSRFSMGWLSLARLVGRELIAFCSAYGPFRTLCEMLWRRVRVMVWNKPIGSQYAGASERGLWFAHETILHGYRPKKKRVRYTAGPKSMVVAAMIREGIKSAGMSCGAVDMALRGRKTGLTYRWQEAACLPSPEEADALVSLLGLQPSFRDELTAAYAAKEVVMKDAREATAEMGREYGAEACDVFTYRTETDSEHPCQKPVRLMAALIRNLTEPTANILDPFAGSGTTGVAAIATGRRAILIEKDPRYADIARRRVAEAMGRGKQSLFRGMV